MWTGCEEWESRYNIVPVPDLAAYQRHDCLAEIIDGLSFFASENPEVAEFDINPLTAFAAGCRSVDTRIIWDKFHIQGLGLLPEVSEISS